MFRSVPLLGLLLIAYFVTVYVGDVGTLDRDLAHWTLLSGGKITFHVGDALLLAGFVLLFIEILKATQTDTGAILNHALSVAIFVLCLIAFLLVKEAATLTFFYITALTLLDVVAGFIVTIITARRDFAVGS